MYSNLLTKALLAASVLVLTSCSNFEFKTNVDPSNFKEYFKPSYAIKFGKCVRLTNTPACLVSVTCYADALVVDDSKHTKSK